MRTDPDAAGTEFGERLLDAVDAAVADARDGQRSAASVGRTNDGTVTSVRVDVEGPGTLEIAIVPPSASPADPDAIDAGHGADRDVVALAACDRRDCFLFDVRDRDDAGEIAYYLDLRDRALPDAVAALLDAAGRLASDGERLSQPPRTRLRGTLRSALEHVQPALDAAAREAYEADRGFAAAFDEWVRTDSATERDRERSFEIAATQYACLLLCLFRRDAIDGRFDGGNGDGGQPGAAQRRRDGDAIDPGVVDGRLRDAVSTIGRRSDDPPADLTLFESFPHDGPTRRRLADAARIAKRLPDGADGAGILGEVYEEHIPEPDRATRGQFYTDPTIASALVRWALDADGDGSDRLPRVLDPAAGSGAFVAETYRALAERSPDASPDAILDRILAVDVERFPLRLTALDLADSAGGGRVRAYHGSFFDLEPDADVSATDRVDALGGHDGAIGRVDAVVGNPPYVEASDLAPDREHFRAHLREFGPSDAAPYLEGDDAIDNNADAYVYFTTQAIRFLRDGGRLAFVVPTKWLTARYGEPFRAFLDDHCRIAAIVGFDARAFEDALIDTALVLLERCDDERARRENVVRFVQLHDRVAPERLLEAVDGGANADAAGEPVIAETDRFRTVGVEQSAFATAEHGTLAHYLVAPPDLIDLLESPDLTALGDLAAVSRGAMTGSTAFFFPEEADVDAHGVEDAFLRPALKSMRGHEAIVCDEGTVDRRFVDVHWYVDAVRERDGIGSGSEQPLEQRVKRALAADGYEGLLSWIRRAEAEGEHRGATCERREVWFDAGEPPRPELLFQKLLRERLFCIYNRAGAVPSNAVDCIDVRPDVDSKALFGVLNSSLVRAIMEVWGRNEAGMLQLMTYETESMPVPDVDAMAPVERDRIAAVVDDILERGSSPLADEDRDRLDRAVLAALETVDLSAERIQDVQRSLLERRVRSGAATEVLVGSR